MSDNEMASSKRAMYKSKFHTTHGPNLEMSADKRTVISNDKPDLRYRFVFSSRPISIYEVIRIRVNCRSDQPVRFTFGFSLLDPDNVNVRERGRFHANHDNPRLYRKHDMMIAEGASLDLAYWFDREGNIGYRMGEQISCIRCRQWSDQLWQRWAIMFLRQSTTVTLIKTPMEPVRNIWDRIPRGVEWTMPVSAYTRTIASATQRHHETWKFATRPLHPDHRVRIRVHVKHNTATEAIIFGLVARDPSKLRDRHLPDDAALMRNDLKRWCTIAALDHRQYARGDCFHYRRMNTREIDYRNAEDVVVGEMVSLPGAMVGKTAWPFLKTNGSLVFAKMYVTVEWTGLIGRNDGSLVTRLARICV